MNVFTLDREQDRTDLARLRNWAAGWTLVYGGGEEAADDVKLVVTELATNAVLYGGGGLVAITKRDGALHMWVIDDQQDLTGLDHLSAAASVVVANVMVTTKRLHPAPGGRAAGSVRLAREWFGAAATKELQRWTPAADRSKPAGKPVLDCFTTEVGRRVLLAVSAIEPANAELMAEGGRGHYLAAQLMDSCGIGVLATRGAAVTS